MANKTLEKVEKIIIPKIEELGFEFEYLESLKENDREILRVVIDKKGENITTEDCEKVSRYIENDIDKEVKDKEYVLEISSAGLEKNLKNIRLYKKYIGEKIFIRLFKKTSFTENFNEKEFEATLIDVDSENENIKLKVNENETIMIELKNVALAHTVFNFDEFFKNN